MTRLDFCTISRQRLVASILTAVTLVLVLWSGCKPPEPIYDVLIQGGSVVDGLGNPARIGDIAVQDGRLVLSPVGGPNAAQEVIDATGLVVAPGFVDVHSHTDVAIAKREQRFNEGFIRQGVTSIVGGPDGGHSPATMRELISAYETNGVGTNVALYVGHNGIRREVMEDDQQRPPTEEELESMTALVKEGMEMGGVGLSTGLMYPPGMFSDTDEVVALAAEVAPYGGIYDSHVRNPAKQWISSNEEAIEIGERAGILTKLGHLKEVGLHNKGLMEQLLALVERSRDEGLRVVSDQYPYDAAAGRLTLKSILVLAPSPQQSRELANDEDYDLRAKFSHPDARARIRTDTENGIDGGFSWIKAIGYTSIRIVSSRDYPQLVGKYLSEIAEEQNVEGFDVITNLITHAEHPVEIKGGIQEETVQELLVQPWNMVASDGGYVDASTTSQGHPRSTGTFPRVLGHYARDLGLLSLEEAVRKMTSFPADTVGLPSRGRLADGLPADVTVFDPQTIIDRSTYEEPNLLSEGVHHVIVNGVFVLRDAELTGNAPGRFLPREKLEQ